MATMRCAFASWPLSVSMWQLPRPLIRILAPVSSEIGRMFSPPFPINFGTRPKSLWSMCSSRYKWHHSRDALFLAFFWEPTGCLEIITWLTENLLSVLCCHPSVNGTFACQLKPFLHGGGAPIGLCVSCGGLRLFETKSDVTENHFASNSSSSEIEVRQ